MKYEVRYIIVRHQGAEEAAQGHHSSHRPGLLIGISKFSFKVSPTDVDINQRMTAATSHPNLIRYQIFHTSHNFTFDRGNKGEYCYLNITAYSNHRVGTGPTAFKL